MMRSTPCADCGAKSFSGATIDGLPMRAVPAVAGDLVVIAWGALTSVVFGAYDVREDDGSRRFALHACEIAA